MQARIVAALFLLASAALYGQTQQTFAMRQPFPTDNRPLTGEEWRFNLVEHLMSFPSPVTNGTIQLRGMGDEAAVDVIKVLSTKPAPTSGELNAALDILHMAFEYPNSILNRADQQPRAALFLLQHLAATVTDQNIKQRITGETESLRVLTARFSPIVH